MSDKCTYNGVEYSPGSVVCQAGTKHQCEAGRWIRLTEKCGESEDGTVLEVRSDRSKATGQEH